MVKADAYGVGAVAVAGALEVMDPVAYGVASAAEGRELRSAGIERPVLVCSPLTEQLPDIAQWNLTPALGSLEQVRAWFGIAGQQRPFQVQVDTGMCRSGFWWEAFGPAHAAFRDAPGFEGVFTHFHSAEANAASVREQLERFRAALGTLPHPPRLVHAANSAAALLRGPETVFDAVRPGIFLYGGAVGPERPRPVVRWLARIVEVHRHRAGATVSYGGTWKVTAPTAIATLAVGYADGLRRMLGNRGDVLIAGRRYAIVGNVTMDLTMVSAPEVAPEGSEIVTLIGADGEEEITVDEMAARAGTISYEILTGLGSRVRRAYV
jgi:alanine racemase